MKTCYVLPATRAHGCAQVTDVCAEKSNERIDAWNIAGIRN